MRKISTFFHLKNHFYNFKNRCILHRHVCVMLLVSYYRCPVNGKTLWLCEEHKNANRSQTEQRYEEKFTQATADIPIPTGGKSTLLTPSFGNCLFAFRNVLKHHQKNVILTSFCIPMVV